MRRAITLNEEMLRHVKLALPSLVRYLAQDMKEEATFRSVALMYRCNCYRALMEHGRALQDATELAEAQPDENAFALLSQCYFDIGDYEKAQHAATEAITRARNNRYRYMAWGNRAEIHRTFGNLAAYEYDQGQQLVLAQMLNLSSET